MNKLNGGYVMLKYDASQEKLKDAYDSGKPVIVYDSNNRGLWAKVTESSGTYSIDVLVGSSDLPEIPKLYKHEISFTYNVYSIALKTVIYNDKSEPYTKTLLKNEFGSPNYQFISDSLYYSNFLYYAVVFDAGGNNLLLARIKDNSGNLVSGTDAVDDVIDTVTEVL